MFFDSLAFTIFISIACIVGTYFALSFLYKYGKIKLKKREFVGLCFVSIVMLCAITYAFFTDFGSY